MLLVDPVVVEPVVVEPVVVDPVVVLLVVVEPVVVDAVVVLLVVVDAVVVEVVLAVVVEPVVVLVLVVVVLVVVGVSASGSMVFPHHRRPHQTEPPLNGIASRIACASPAICGVKNTRAVRFAFRIRAKSSVFVPTSALSAIITFSPAVTVCV